MKHSPSTVHFCMPSGLGIGGSSLWSLRTAQALARGAWRTNLFTHRSHTTTPRLAMADWPGVRERPCPGRFPGYARERDARAYARVYGNHLPGLFIPNWSVGTHAACAHLAKTHAPDMRVLAVVHGTNPIQCAIAAYYESIVHRFIAVSEEVAALLRQVLPDRAADIEVKSCPVEVPPALDRTENTDRPLRLAYAGRITDFEKRVSRLVPLSEKLAAAGIPFTLDVYGDGRYAPALRAQRAAASPRVRAAIRLHGQVAPGRMPEIWRATDICVLVSDAEGSPLCVLEAMAQGAVPVAMRVSGIPAIIGNERCGFQVAAGDLDGMVDSIAAVHRHREELATMGRAAHRRVQERFAADAYYVWLDGILREIEAAAPRAWPGGRPLLDARLRTPAPGPFRRLREILAVLGRR